MSNYRCALKHRFQKWEVGLPMGAPMCDLVTEIVQRYILLRLSKLCLRGGPRSQTLKTAALQLCGRYEAAAC